MALDRLIKQRVWAGAGQARSRSARSAERDVTPPRRRREEETATGAFEFLASLLRRNKFKALPIQIQSGSPKNTIAFSATMRSLDEMAVFAKTVVTASLSGAARELGVSTAAVSQAGIA